MFFQDFCQYGAPRWHQDSKTFLGESFETNNLFGDEIFVFPGWSG